MEQSRVFFKNCSHPFGSMCYRKTLIFSIQQVLLINGAVVSELSDRSFMSNVHFKLNLLILFFIGSEVFNLLQKSCIC